MKHILLLVCLIGFTLSIHLKSHRTTQNSFDLPALAESLSKINEGHMRFHLEVKREALPADQKVFKEMFGFIVKHPEIKQAMDQKRPLTEEQNAKVLDFFLNNQVMFNFMLKNFQRTNNIVTDLPEESKKKFVRITLTGMSQSGFNLLNGQGGPSTPEEQQELHNTLMKEYLKDPEITKEFVRSIPWSLLTKDQEAVAKLKEVPEFAQFDFQNLNWDQKTEIFKYIAAHPQLRH